MKPLRWTIKVAGAALLVAGVLAGCASGTPDRFYTLAGPIDVQPSPRPNGAASAPLVIELLPLSMPERLARPQIVLRRGGGHGVDASNAAGDSAEVEVLEGHRWASSLEHELRDALSAGIAARLGAIDATRSGGATGRAPGTPAWRIALQVRQFDAVENTRVDAVFSWSIRRSDDERSASCVWRASEPVARGIGAVADGAQRVTAAAAEAIAQQVAGLAAGRWGNCAAAPTGGTVLEHAATELSQVQNRKP